MAKSNFPWKKNVKPSLLALEPRMLFDGAAAATPPDSVPTPIPEALPVAQADTAPTDTSIESVSRMLNVDPVVKSTAQIEPVQDISQIIDARTDVTLVADDSLIGEVSDGVEAKPAGLINIDQPVEQKLSFAVLKVESSLMELLHADSWAEQLYAQFPGDQSSMTQQWLEAAESFKQGVLEGGLSANVQLRASGELLGVNGAYAENGLDGTPLIFLNQDRLDANDQQYATSVLMEEVGHWIDHQINGSIDTQGDEGERFAAFMLGLQLSDLEAQRVATENDRIVLNIDGQAIEVEMASILFSGQSYYVNGDVGLESNVLTLGDPLPGSRTVFVSDPIDAPYFTGNNVKGTIHVLDANNKITASFFGEISRLLKVGSSAVGLQFYVYPAGTSSPGGPSQSLLIDVYGTDSTVLATGQAQKTSSDPVATALNGMLPTNQLPIANADVAIAVEAGGTLNGTLGTNPSGNLLSNDTGAGVNYVVDFATMELKAVSGSLSFMSIKNDSTGSTATPSSGSTSDSSPSSVGGLYGTLKVGADGSYIYEVNNNSAAVQALRLSSDTLTETFTYTVTDGKGGISSSTLTITIQGKNDSPIAFDDYNFAKESIESTVSSQYSSSDSIGEKALGNVLINDTDVDGYGETKTIDSLVATATGQTSGSSVLNFASGVPASVKVGFFVFSANSASSPLLDADGKHVTVATISGTSVSLIGDAKLSGAGTLYFSSQSTSMSNNGGAGSYSGSTATSSPGVEVSLTTDGYISKGMAVSGTGVVAGTTVSAVTYDANGNVIGVTLSQSATISASTVLQFTAPTGVTLTGQYGTFVLSPDGSYVYTPFANNPNLAPGQTVVDEFKYRMRDASGATSDATVFITVIGSGLNDPDANPSTMTALEAGGINNGTEGVDPLGNLLTDSPADTTTSGTNTVVAIKTAQTATETALSAGTQSYGGVTYDAKLIGLYGDLYVKADGAYKYVITNNNSTVDSLQSGQSLSEVFQYKITNGLGIDWSTLTITVIGANDAPSAVDDTNTAIAGVYDPTGNVLPNDSDVDTTDTKSVSKIAVGSTLASPSTVNTSTTSANGALLTGHLWSFNHRL